MVSEDMLDKLQRALDGERGRNLPPRFYKEVQVGGEAPALSVLLDERPIKTPMKAALAVPSMPLAEAVAGEWRNQIEHVDPATMPLTRLCNTAIDRVSGDPVRIVDELVDFAGSDLVCYRADDPDELVARQQSVWDPLLKFAEQSLGAQFVAVSGLMHHEQPTSALEAMAQYLGDQDVFRLTAIHNMTTLTGSCIVATAVSHGCVNGSAAWSAAHVDEDWQIEHWGEDAEGAIRRSANRREFDAALKLLELLGKCQ